MVGHLKEDISGLLKLNFGVVSLPVSFLVADESNVDFFGIRKRLSVAETRKSGSGLTVPVQQDVIQLENPIAVEPCITDVVKTLGIGTRGVRNLNDIKVTVAWRLIYLEPAGR